MDVRDVLASASFREDRMAKVNLFETERFFCDLYCLRPGQAQKVHTHDRNDKVYFALRGAGKVIVGEAARTLREGEIVLAAAGEPHGLENDSSADLVCLVFMAPHPGGGG